MLKDGEGGGTCTFEVVTTNGLALVVGASIKLKALCFSGKLWGGITILPVLGDGPGVGSEVTTTEEAIFLNFL